MKTNCKACNIEFYVPVRYEVKYCPTCSKVSKARLIKCSLENCNNLIYVPKYYENKRRYCCMEHRNLDKTWHKDRIESMRKTMMTGQLVKCSYCNEEFYLPKNRIEIHSKHHFCKGHRNLYTKEYGSLISKESFKEIGKKVSKTLKSLNLKRSEKTKRAVGDKNKQHYLEGRGASLLKGREVPLKRRKKISQKLLGHAPQYPKPYFVSELGHGVRSSLEEIGLLILKRNNINYIYEKPYKVLMSDGIHVFRPDVTLENDLIIEFKGWPVEAGLKRLELLSIQYPLAKFVLVTTDGAVIRFKEFSERTKIEVIGLSHLLDYIVNTCTKENLTVLYRTV